MDNINKNPQHHAQLSRNGFDMSMIRKFSSSVGMLLPVYWDYLLPGDKVKFNAEMFSRTQPLTSPAFVQFTNHVDWFFVPCNQLYQFFGEAQFGIKDYKTTLVSSSSIRAVPLANVSDIANAVQNGDTDSYYFGNFEDNSMRLLKLLGYSSRIGLTSSSQANQKVNTLLLQAYQKIFNDVYRLSDRDRNDQSSYNADQFFASDVGSTSLNRMLQLRFRAWKKDLFTDLQVSPLINGGDIGMLTDANLASVNQWLNTSSSVTYQNPNPLIVNDKNVGSVNLYDSGSGTASVSASNTSIALRNVVSTSNIRSMFAIEKLSEITRRASKHYDAQVLAHFGFDVPTGISGEVYRLGSDSSIWNVGEIASTADTLGDNVGQPLGELAGKALSYGNGKQKEFTAPCHGIFMGIYSCVPEADYSDEGIDRFNTYVNREDFYQPEFDRLGMQPEFYFQRRAIFENSSLLNSIIGWQYRYAEMKSKYNVSNLNFTLRNWTTMRNQSPYGDLRDFLINPLYLNSIMSVQQTSALQEEFDPIINMFQFHVYKTSVMSTYGLPSL